MVMLVWPLLSCFLTPFRPCILLVNTFLQTPHAALFSWSAAFAGRASKDIEGHQQSAQQKLTIDFHPFLKQLLAINTP
jgi:hypothetical protein